MAKAVLPPQAKEAEEVIIGSILLNPERFRQAQKYIIEDEVFYDDRNKMIWNKLKKMISINAIIDQTTVLSEFTDKEKNEGVTAYYITGLTTNAMEQENIESYAQIIYKKYLLRRLIKEAHYIKDSAYLANGNAMDILSETHNTIGALIDLQPNTTFDIEDAMLNTVDSIKHSERNLIPTGYRSIDRMCGGLTRGEITIIGGRPGHGKSTFTLNILKNMIDKGFKCMLINREMSNVEMLKKLVVLESGMLSYSLVRSGACGDKTTLKEIDDTVKKIQKKYNKDKFLMFDNIRDFSQASAEIKRFKPDVIFDDYIQLIVPDSKIEQRRLQLEKIIHDYKWLVKNIKAAVVCVSQLNRSMETRGNPVPRLSDLAESGAIEQAAENVFFTYYDYKIFKHKSIERGYGKDVIEIIAGKVRYGETGSAKMNFKGDGVKISEKY